MHPQDPTQESDAANRKPTAESRKPAPLEPWIPESKLTPLPKDSVNSFVRNILLTNPLFPKFYADMVISSAPNSNEANILRTHYQKILNRISMPTFTTCTHIKVTGVRCGSAPLRGEQFCYFHQHAHRGVRKPPQSRLHPIAILEDEESIQSSLMEVINALMRNTIDLKRAELILRALHIAVKNARRVKFDIHAGDTVREIPEYAAANVGADAFVRPSGKAAVETPSEVELQPQAEQQLEDELPPSASIPPARTRSAREQRNLATLHQEQDRQADIRARLTRAAESMTGATGAKRPAQCGNRRPRLFKHRHEKCRYGRIRPYRRTSRTGPQRTPPAIRLSPAPQLQERRSPNASPASRSHKEKAVRKPEHSSEGAKEYSPRR